MKFRVVMLFCILISILSVSVVGAPRSLGFVTVQNESSFSENVVANFVVNQDPDPAEPD